MVRILEISSIFLLLILFVDIEAQSPGWEQVPPDNYDYLVTELQKSLTQYLGKQIYVCHIIMAVSRNNYADDVRYVIFAEVAEDYEQAFYTMEAYFVFRGDPAIRVSYAKRYDLWQYI